MENYKIGDKVKIRSWKSMENEFGLNWWDDIKSYITFTRKMRESCGRVMTITDELGLGTSYSVDGGGRFVYSRDTFVGGIM
mgnify:CR=1 FL=1